MSNQADNLELPPIKGSSNNGDKDFFNNRSEKQLKEISEHEADSANERSLSPIKIHDQRSPHYEEKIEGEIADLIREENLVEMFDIIPTAFVLSKAQANDWKAFKKRFSDIHICKGLCPAENVPGKHCQHNQWIVKPEGLNQGKGIELFSKLRDIYTFMKK